MFKTDLDHGNAYNLAIREQRRREIVARLAAGDTDAEEPAGPAPHAICEVGAVGQVLSDKAVRSVPVAGSNHMSLPVEQIDRQRARPVVELFEVAVDGVGERFSARDQVDYVPLQAKRRREVGVFVDLPVQAGGVDFEALGSRSLQLSEPQVLADAKSGNAGGERHGDEARQQQAVFANERGDRHGNEWKRMRTPQQCCC
ncbi:hypothetical protein D9M68_380360 [compost metagenome]